MNFNKRSSTSSSSSSSSSSRNYISNVENEEIKEPFAIRYNHDYPSVPQGYSAFLENPEMPEYKYTIKYGEKKNLSLVSDFFIKMQLNSDETNKKYIESLNRYLNGFLFGSKYVFKTCKPIDSNGICDGYIRQRNIWTAFDDKSEKFIDEHVRRIFENMNLLDFTSDIKKDLITDAKFYRYLNPIGNKKEAPASEIKEIHDIQEEENEENVPLPPEKLFVEPFDPELFVFLRDKFKTSSDLKKIIEKMTIIDWELDGLDAEMYPKHLNSIPNNRAFKYEIKDDAKYKPIKITDITNIKKNFTIDNIFSDIVFDDIDGSKYKFVVKFNPIRLYKNTLKNLIYKTNTYTFYIQIFKETQPNETQPNETQPNETQPNGGKKYRIKTRKNKSRKNKSRKNKSRKNKNRKTRSK